jgi:hypothetical protein
VPTRNPQQPGASDGRDPRRSVLFRLDRGTGRVAGEASAPHAGPISGDDAEAARAGPRPQGARSPGERRRSEGWWVKFKGPDGAWRAQGTGAQTKAEAKALLVELEARAERQRLGLEPRTRNPDGWTLAELLRWWLDEYSRHLASHGRNLSAIRKHLLAAPLAAKKLEHVTAAEIEGLSSRSRATSAPRPSTTCAGSWSARSTRRSSAASGSARIRPRRSIRARSLRRS